MNGDPITPEMQSRLIIRLVDTLRRKRAITDAQRAEIGDLRNEIVLSDYSLRRAIAFSLRQQAAIDQLSARIEELETLVKKQGEMLDACDFAFEKAGELLHSSVQHRIVDN